ncbi:uncharacterized protein STEHIDRAFT_133509 [Stereum hirsutum FP-91666 SS1]|uniref:uncharacterized protein n=1 Tax=Stereum hirsutum (strain FP-91666) TaxID=721885 RepID=UPI0004449663|nr:uncharacterized protein STEHIDRAFT_133509 [Stereum hirsutum FP-91666 SS1]EIM83665.1 hypothetical protein STEHIDRAFT_133509 [Stereum hirsutum FP-91666 SS1]
MRIVLFMNPVFQSTQHASTTFSRILQCPHGYRQVPTFGRDTIRKFHTNASEMKKLAARDFEHLLQCAIPVFEGLFPGDHDKIVSDLLFDLSSWHAYAKMRLHLTSTLLEFDDICIEAGNSLRKFADKTCQHFTTFELPQEVAARKRREERAREKAMAFTSSTSLPPPPPPIFQPATHRLADYPSIIRRSGTTDAYNSQLVSSRFLTYY